MMKHDIHIHTSLSDCAKREATFERYMERFSFLKMPVIGFTDHLWDKGIPGANAWYVPQDLEHVLKLKEEIRSKKDRFPGTKIYFGCETEYIGNGVVGLHADHSEVFDFILVPPHHFHITGMVRPPEISGGKALIQLYLDRFLEVCQISFAFGIAHPFVPLGLPGQEKAILENLPEKALEECFLAAAENQKSIEINLSCLKKLSTLDLLEQYGAIMQIAAEKNCRFHIGSDAHSETAPAGELYALGDEFAARYGITFPENPFTGE